MARAVERAACSKRPLTFSTSAIRLSRPATFTFIPLTCCASTSESPDDTVLGFADGTCDPSYASRVFSGFNDARTPPTPSPWYRRPLLLCPSSFPRPGGFTTKSEAGEWLDRMVAEVEALRSRRIRLSPHIRGVVDPWRYEPLPPEQSHGNVHSADRRHLWTPWCPSRRSTCVDSSTHTTAARQTRRRVWAPSGHPNRSTTHL